MLLLPFFAHAQEGYGLEFSAKNIVPEMRTSLMIPDVQRHAGQTFSLSFDLSFVPQSPSYFGYLFRLIDDKEQNIDLLYNVHTRTLQLVTGNEFSGIDYPLEASALVNQWKTIKIDIAEGSHTITMTANRRVVGRVANKIVLGKQLKLLFGANHDGSFKNIDLPPMRLRDIKIYDGEQLSSHFLLAQQQGARDTDLVSGKIAYAEHAVWLQPRYHNWQPAGSFSVKGNTSVAFNEREGIIYITGQDSLIQVNVAHMTPASIALTQPTGAPAGNQTVYDDQHQRLYNFMPDDKKVAVFDSAHKRWSTPIDANKTTRYWHPAIFYASSDSAMYVIGGYGDYEFKNAVHRFHPATQTWDTPSVAGERLIPRYLSAVGMNGRGDSAYIFGGYGSLQGAQLLNPHNLYDLLVYDVKRNAYTKIYTLPKPETPFAFAGNLVIDSVQHAGYALTFANDRMQSSLQLIRADLKRPQYTKLGARIPFPFIDTKADASLYYSPQTGQLIAVTFYSADNKATVVKIYTLMMPVNVPLAPSRHGFFLQWEQSRWLIIAFIGLLLAGVCALYYLRRKGIQREQEEELLKAQQPAVVGQTIVIKRPAAKPAAPVVANEETLPGGVVSPEAPVLSEMGTVPVSHEAPVLSARDTASATGAKTTLPITPESSIVTTSSVLPPLVATTLPPENPALPTTATVHLFGHFTVTDKEGQDITRLFSPLVKELFLLILLPNLNGEQGITSEKLSETLWPSMTAAAAKNNRSVNIAKLRNVLEKIGGYSLVKENGKWRLLLDESSVYIDLQAYRQLTPLSLSADNNLLSHYTALLRRGGFLEETEYAWMDTYKNEITNNVITQLNGYLQTHADTASPATIIEVTNCILHFDALSEDAVMHQCRALVQLHQHASARKLYTRFQKEYQNIYGEKFEMEYTQVVEGIV